MSLVTAILIGLLMGAVFGFALEKSRVFEPGVIVGQMQLRNFIMLKVFLTAVATGAVVLAVLNGFGFVKLAPKATLYGADIVGGLILGMGIALAGACPGTVMAQIGAGYRDAIVTLIGGIAGAVAYSYAEPALSKTMLGVSSGKLVLNTHARHPVLGRRARAGGYLRRDPGGAGAPVPLGSRTRRRCRRRSRPAGVAASRRHALCRCGRRVADPVPAHDGAGADRSKRRPGACDIACARLLQVPLDMRVLALVLFLSAIPQVALAQYCMLDDSGGRTCGIATLQQCEQTRAGVGGSCEVDNSAQLGAPIKGPFQRMFERRGAKTPDYQRPRSPDLDDVPPPPGN